MESRGHNLRRITFVNLATVSALLLGLVIGFSLPAYAEGCDYDGDGKDDDGIIIGGQCTDQKGEDSPEPGDGSDNQTQDGTYPEITLTYPCEPNNPNQGRSNVRCNRLPMCGSGVMNETYMPYWEWERRVTWEDGVVSDTTPWKWTDQVCMPPEEAPDELRTPTREEITDEVKQVLPKGEPLAQPPNGRTLVNFDTIFRMDTSDVDPFEATVEVLGRDVDIEARPTTFSWRFGDNSPRLDTNKPGRKYPHKDVVHDYQDTGRYDVDVDVTYTARFRLPGGGWNDLGDIEITDGPTMSLRVLESRSVISD